MPQIDIRIEGYEAFAYHGDVVVATTRSQPRLENSERWVAYVIYRDGDARWAEELDIDILTSVAWKPDLLERVAEAAAKDGLEPGWTSIELDGPKIGLYF